MEALAQTEPARNKGEAADLQLLLDWREPEQGAKRAVAAAGSLLVHLGLFGLLIALPSLDVSTPERPTEMAVETHKAVTLVAPHFQLTQKAPNKGEITKEIRLENLLPHPTVKFTPPTTQRPAAHTPSVTPSQTPLPQPPQIEVAPKLAQAPQFGTSPIPQPAPPPQPQTQEKPKLAFETPGAPQGSNTAKGGLGTTQIQVPKATVDEAVRSAARAGSGGLVVGDTGEDVGGLGQSLNQPPAPGRPKSSVELLSDPMGVDFKPYLIRVLMAVRRNWFSVIPESAKMGRQGKVIIQFSIARDGHVPKLVIAMPSGAEALDRAAVAGISASNPFPPLPPEFHGEVIRLQFAFAYNVR